MVTFSDEVQLVWSRKVTGAAVIFLLNRYLVLALGVAIMLQTSLWDTPLVSLSSFCIVVISSVLPSSFAEVCLCLRSAIQCLMHTFSDSCEATILLYEVVNISLYAVAAGEFRLDTLMRFGLCISISVFSTLRTYAISGFAWSPAIVTLILGLLPAAASTVSQFLQCQRCIAE